MSTAGPKCPTPPQHKQLSRPECSSSCDIPHTENVRISCGQCDRVTMFALLLRKTGVFHARARAQANLTATLPGVP